MKATGNINRQLNKGENESVSLAEHIVSSELTKCKYCGDLLTPYSEYTYDYSHAKSRFKSKVAHVYCIFSEKNVGKPCIVCNQILTPYNMGQSKSIYRRAPVHLNCLPTKEEMDRTRNSKGIEDRKTKVRDD